MRLVIALGLVASLAACAPYPAPYSARYQADYVRLAQDCYARGGVLIPRAGPTTGNPATQFACQATGAYSTR